MNLVFNIGEQLSELCHFASENPLPGLDGCLGRDFWRLYMEEDAKHLLRHYLHKRGKRAQYTNLNCLFTEAVIRLMMDTGFDNDEDGEAFLRIYRDPTNYFLEDNEKGGYTVLHTKDLPRDANGEILPPPAPFKRNSLDHLIDDFVDEVYYEIHLEVDDFVHGFTRRGDLWTCKSYGNHLLFEFCCNTATIESAIRASGGNYAEFIAHMTS